MSNPASGPQTNGNLSDTFLPGLFCRLHRGSFSGTIQFRKGPTGKAVYFRDGNILSASSNHASDRLSTLLLRDGLLSPQQLEMAKEKLRPGTSLGRCLVELGFVSRNQLMDTARNQVRGILQSLFDWDTGLFEIMEDQIPPSVPQLGMDTPKLLFETITGSSNRPAVVADLGGMDRKFARGQGFHARWGKLSLGDEAKSVYSLVDPTRRVVDICNESSLDDFQITKILCAGFHLGLLEALPTAPGPTLIADSPAVTRRLEVAVPETPAVANPLPAAPEPSRPGIPSATAAAPRAAAGNPWKKSPPPARSAPKPAAADPEGPFHGYVDTSPGKSGGMGSGPARGKGSSRPRWIALGGLLVAVALGSFGVLLLTTGGSSEPGIAEAGPPDPTEVLDPAPAAAADIPEEGGAKLPGSAPPDPPPSKPDAAGPRLPVVRAEPVPDATPSPPVAPAPVAEPPGPGEEARRSLAEGEFPRAARQFRTFFSRQPPGSYTLQLMVACSAKTISGMMPPPEGLAILPFRFRERDCYRVCWGTYPDRSTALRARNDLPPGIPKLADPPLPVAISRAVGTGSAGAEKRP